MIRACGTVLLSRTSLANVVFERSGRENHDLVTAGLSNSFQQQLTENAYFLTIGINSYTRSAFKLKLFVIFLFFNAKTCTK